MSKVTPEWLADFSGRIFDLTQEAEIRFGNPDPCQYPSDVEMLLHMAHNAARRKSLEMKDAIDLPAPTREELFTNG
jgi:hypothetical protein